jgi:hypothetical protein
VKVIAKEWNASTQWLLKSDMNKITKIVDDIKALLMVKISKLKKVLKRQTLISYVSVVIIQKVIVTVKKPLVNPMTGEMDLGTMNDISQDLYQRRETLPQRIIGFLKL